MMVINGHYMNLYVVIVLIEIGPPATEDCHVTICYPEMHHRQHSCEAFFVDETACSRCYKCTEVASSTFGIHRTKPQLNQWKHNRRM